MKYPENVFQYRKRLESLIVLESIQTNHDAKMLVQSERFYVETLINFLDKYKGMEEIKLEAE